MGRSKFPGKPSKPINRKRVTVLPPNRETPSIDESVILTDDKQLSDAEESKTEQEEENNTAFLTKKHFPKKLQAPRSLRNSTGKRSMVSRICVKNALKNKIKRNKNGKAIGRKCYVLTNVPRCGQREGGNLGKFILPSRSVHSSRVIKPNKRFLDVNESLTRKQKIRRTPNGDDTESNGSSKNACKEASQSSTCSNRRIVLRQARLQFHSQLYPSNSQGPFSTNANNLSTPGTVTCGVCGAVRFYRFIKQARKFNIYSCESCRKFISKIIKRQSFGKVIKLVCNKGQGTCHVPPIVRSQQWKLIKCAYRARCPACWLKMCLRSFQMPVTLKNNLLQLLPQYMQNQDSIFGNSSVFWPSGMSSIEVNVNKVTTEDRAFTQRPLRSNQVAAPAPVSSSVLTNCTEIKRQKIDCKGPRVKHVCRSASIVLGQPIATFSEADKSRGDSVKQISDKTFYPDVISVSDWKELKTDLISSESESLDTDKFAFSSVTDISATHVRRDHSHRITSQMLAQDKYNEKDIEDIPHTISIDFWENYDPEDVSQNGFSLISSEKFPMPSICFLCGSAGLEALLHCSACCEPYHPFCLDQAPQLSSYNVRQSMWLCPRCTICSSCKRSDRTKVNCQKCFKAYHLECLNYGFDGKWPSGDRPTICSKCLRCKSCGTENITKFVGNLPLCLTCLRLRKKGNFCPLCQKCYYENDFCSKMMECAHCNKWVHSKCEGLLEEQYQILSLLPESIEYICKVCSKNSTPFWRKAVDSELKACFNNVLRLLSKNKIARDLLKWSPLGNNSSSNKTIITVKKLQFNNEHDSGNVDIQNNNDIDDSLSFNFNSSEQKLSKSNGLKTMLDIKNKLNSNEYHSVREYDTEMEEALNYTQSDQIIHIYRSILHNVFPWYESSEKDEPGPISPNTVENEVSESIDQDKEVNNMPHMEFANEDIRSCAFCKGVGDGLGEHESRLLYCGQNEWVHANCALWSSEVYEEIDGSLQNVHSALSRGRSIKCSICKQKGASVGCCFKGCYETYHFLCARKVNCAFFHDKTVFCAYHQLPKDSNVITTSHDFEIRRSVYVELDKKKGKFCEIDKVNFMVGSLCVTNLGKIVPSLSDDYQAIIPIGFVCSRLFWSTVEPWKLVCYKISTSPNKANDSTSYTDRNFTIDHTLSESVVEKKIKELNVWQKDLERRKTEVMDLDDEEEPQNPTDILSPELTDAILKELPHGLLDGIFVQDIIPKLMPYEDLHNIDSGNVDDLDLKYLRDSQKYKSDNMSLMNDNSDKLNREKNQQRSCSVTLSCKLDRSLSPVVKKRKAIPSHDKNLYFKLLQVDGNFDDSGSECGSPTGFEAANPWHIVTEEPVTCEKCQCTYRTQASYKRHLDNCELLCTSESDSEVVHEPETTSTSLQETRSITTSYINGQHDNNQQPIIINSFETFQQNQLQTSVLNSFVKSKSSSQVIAAAAPHDLIIQSSQLEEKSVIPTFAQAPMAINSQQEQNGSYNEQTFRIGQQTVSINDTMPNNPFCVNQTTVPLCVNQPMPMQTNTLTLNQTTPSLIGPSNAILNPLSLNQIAQPSIQQTVEFTQPVTFQSVPFSGNVTQPIINIANQNQISLNGKILSNNNILNSVVTQTLNVPTNQWIKPLMQDKQFKSRSRARTILSKRTGFGENETIVIPQQNPTASSVIVQPIVPASNFVPTFVDTFPQQTGQNVQYITTIAPQINHQPIQTQPLVQIQPDNNLISLLPGMQPVIIQQPRMLENQLILDTNGTISWTQAPQQIQPLYYGFETIVQNTVMQSQQFLPTTMPGVLTSNSSYSTTTQVFQTSKLEPVLDVSSNSFLLVNPNQLISSQPSIEIQRYSQPLKSNVASSDESARCEPVKYCLVSQKTTPPISNTNSINLPTVPFMQEQGIPTNIVTPTPKVVQVQNRPMSRVLPMQTTQIKDKQQPLKSIDVKIEEVVKKPNEVQGFIDIQKRKSCSLGRKANETKTIVSKNNVHKAAAVYYEKSKNLSSPLLEIQKTVDSLISKNEPALHVNVPLLGISDLPHNEISKTPPISIESDQICIEEEDSKISCSFETKTSIDATEPPMLITDTENSSNKIPTTDEIFNSLIQSQHLKLSDRTSPKPLQKENIDVKNESLRIVFQKQSRDGTYKITNTSKTSNVQIAPLKPIKSSASPLSQHNKTTSNNIPKCVKKEKKFVNETIPENKTNESQSILYTIETQEGFKYSSTSVSELWAKVFEAVQTARIAHNMPALPDHSLMAMNNLHVLGLTNNGLKYLLEQLPDVSKCTKYQPTHHFGSINIDLEDEYSIGHSCGTIRCAPHTKKYNQYDMFGWLSSKHRKPENAVLYDMELPRRASVNNLPMAMRFRQLKLTSRYSVGVYRSNIHGRGLFCLRDIEAGDMVIEYAGEVIRSILCDKREREYNKKGIGCYMFRIDDNLVVDATMKGNAARFINHSCDPNCYSKVVEILGHKHIIIFALRRIMCSEELTYDYKFPFEEDKIPCTCGSRRCRKFLN